MNFIPEGVTAIESGQFRNGTFTEIEIPASVTCIESGAFLDCCQLQRVYFNAVNCKTCGKKTMPVFGNYGDVQVTYNYGYFGVTNMNVVEILIGEGVKTIPNFLLTGTNVASFHIPASVEKVDAPLMTNDGTEIVTAGGTSVEDSVITGSMNYLVEGVKNA